ncbi:MAG: hypothetical protein JNJ45_06955 [Chthonomonas sp.]|nr:hypothetical protein [Chthonomonas sp.]
MDIGRKLQGLSSHTLYVLLILFAGLPLFLSCKIPNEPEASSIDAFATLRELSKDKPVLIETDWSLSTRGESGGQFEALMRMLMRQEIKFAFYSVDPINIAVARTTIARLSKENLDAGGKEYRRWDDYVDLGVKPGLEATVKAFEQDMGKALAANRSFKTDGSPGFAKDSPVLQNVKKLSDFSALVIVTGTGSWQIVTDRLAGKIPIVAMLTGVMSPEALPYHKSGQLTGLSGGIKGVYDIEGMMERGLAHESLASAPKEAVKTNNPKYAGKYIEGFPGKKNMDRAMAYYPALHFALALLIILVIIGNVGLLMSKRNGGK